MYPNNNNTAAPGVLPNGTQQQQPQGNNMQSGSNPNTSRYNNNNYNQYNNNGLQPRQPQFHAHGAVQPNYRNNNNNGMQNGGYNNNNNRGYPNHNNGYTGTTGTGAYQGNANNRVPYNQRYPNNNNNNGQYPPQQGIWFPGQQQQQQTQQDPTTPTTTTTTTTTDSLRTTPYKLYNRNAKRYLVWPPDIHDLFLSLLEIHGPNWQLISEQTKRTSTQCKDHYFDYAQDPEVAAALSKYQSTNPVIAHPSSRAMAKKKQNRLLSPATTTTTTTT
eukprot:UN00217